MSDARVNCGSRRGACICPLDEGHNGPHVCDCKGSWDDEGWVYAWPGVFALDPDFPPLPYFEPPQVSAYGRTWSPIRFSRSALMGILEQDAL